MQMQHIKQANKVLSEIYCQKNLVKVTKHFATLFVPNKRQILQKKVQTKAWKPERLGNTDWNLSHLKYKER